MSGEHRHDCVAVGQRVPGYVPPLASFLARRVIAAPGERLDWADVYRAFAGPGTGWRSTPPPRSVAQAMAYICKAKGVPVIVDGSRVYCLDCALQ
jgi:hypothetical protein